MTALARKLQSRGHEVVFIGVPNIEPVVRAANLDFAPFCENEYPAGSVPKSWGAVATMHSLEDGSVATLELRRSLAIASAKLDPHRAEQTKNEAMG
jgi:zeaxanthin glucosyltransferase